MPIEYCKHQKEPEICICHDRGAFCFHWHPLVGAAFITYISGHKSMATPLLCWWVPACARCQTRFWTASKKSTEPHTSQQQTVHSKMAIAVGGRGFRSSDFKLKFWVKKEHVFTSPFILCYNGKLRIVGQ